MLLVLLRLLVKLLLLLLLQFVEQLRWYVSLELGRKLTGPLDGVLELAGLLELVLGEVGREVSHGFRLGYGVGVAIWVL